MLGPAGAHDLLAAASLRQESLVGTLLDLPHDAIPVLLVGVEATLERLVAELYGPHGRTSHELPHESSHGLVLAYGYVIDAVEVAVVGDLEVLDGLLEFVEIGTSISNAIFTSNHEPLW